MTEDTSLLKDGRGRKPEHPVRKIDPSYESSFTVYGKKFTNQDKLWTFISTLSKTQLQNEVFKLSTNRRYELDKSGITKQPKKLRKHY